MAKKTKDSNLSLEERLEQALIPNWDEPYKLPQNWCWVRVDVIASIYTGNSINERIKEEKYTGRTDGLVYLATKDIDFDSTIDYETNVCIPQSDGFKVAPKYSTLLCIEGGSAGRKIGFITQDVCFVNKLCAFVPHSKINPKYLYYAIQSDAFKKQFDAKKHGLIGGVSVKEVSSIFIPFAPVEIQNKIVELIESVFNKLDEAKEKAQEVVDGFETRKAGILHKAFSGEFCTIDSSSNLDELLSDIFSYRENLIKSKVIQRAKLKAMEDKDIISSFPSSWKQLKLGEISFVTKLAGFEYTKYIKLEESGDIPVVRAQNVRKGYLDTTNLLYIDRQTSENLSRSALDKPSILITFIGAGIGDVCVFDKPQRFHLAPNVAKVEPYCDENGAINIKFLLYYLLSPSGQKEIFKSMKAVAQPSLSMETIRDIVIPFASREEQDEIVRVVENLIIKEQNAKETAEAVIEQIETMKKAILARAFRGELGTNDPSEESAVELLKSVLLGNTNQQEPQKNNKKITSIPNHIETALLTKLEKKIVSLFYTTERKVVSVDEIMSVSSKKIDIIDTLTKLEQRGIIIRLNNSCYRIKE